MSKENFKLKIIILLKKKKKKINKKDINLSEKKIMIIWKRII